jgi:hypothetical protein
VGKAIPMGKTRKLEQPWLTIDGGDGWEYRVLQAHVEDPNKPYASWFCAVKSPNTFGGWDMGDTYISQIRGVIVQRDPSVPDEAIPARLRATLVSRPGFSVVDARELER